MDKATLFKTIEYKIGNQSKWTFDIKPIKEFLLEEFFKKINTNPEVEKTVLNIFAGKNSINQNWSNVWIINNDISDEFESDTKIEAIEFLKGFKNESIEMIIFDPPFNLDMHKKLYLGIDQYSNYGKWIWDIKKEIARVLIIGGVCFSCGYETNGIGAIKGFEKDKLLVVAHGGLLRDTFCYTEIKRDRDKHYNTWRNKGEQ